MIKKELEIRNEMGLHARPAAVFVQLCNKFKSNITLKVRNNAVNAKSIIGVLALGVSSGDIIEIEVDGQDEEVAIIELENLVETKLQNMK